MPDGAAFRQSAADPDEGHFWPRHIRWSCFNTLSLNLHFYVINMSWITHIPGVNKRCGELQDAGSQGRNSNVRFESGCR